MNKLGFFNVGERLKRLRDIGDQLEAYRRGVNFDIFRPDLVHARKNYVNARWAVQFGRANIVYNMRKLVQIAKVATAYDAIVAKENKSPENRC